MNDSFQFPEKQNFRLCIGFCFCFKLFSLSILILIVSSGCQPKWDIDNPYNDVDWANHKQYKAEFHAHTTRSDGSMNPHSVVDMYHQNGYHILAISDHDRVTYPWESFSEMEPSDLAVIRMEYGLSGMEPESSRYRPRDIHLLNDDLVFESRDPSGMGMVSIMGNEISDGQHDMLSYFNDYKSSPNTEEESLKATAAKNGLTMFAHPGRYNYSIEWYLDFYERYDHLIGLELYNRGLPRCSEIWDSLLMKMMPERPVWGLSNNDMHTPGHFGRNWNVFILPELSKEWVRKGMEQGRFFFVYASDGRHDRPASPPVIESIEVNARRGEINIRAIDQDSVVWISGGRNIYKGNKINLNEFPEINGYVRAVVYKDEGTTLVGTQPFGIDRF